MWMRLWNDESGVVISAELVMILSILGIGMLAGATSLRDAIITELADTGQAIGNTNQSFNISRVIAPSASTAGSTFNDAFDFCDNGVGGSNSRGLIISSPGPLSSLEGAGGGNNAAGS